MTRPRPSDQQLQALCDWLMTQYDHPGRPLPDELGHAMIWLCEVGLPSVIMSCGYGSDGSDTVSVFDELFLIVHNGYDESAGGYNP